VFLEHACTIQPIVIIDVHGHYTTAPSQLRDWRQRQIDNVGRPFVEELSLSDEEIRETIELGQLRLQQERGTDLALFSPTAGGMGHHFGDEATSIQWTRTVNDLVHRVCEMFPGRFVGVCQLPQSPNVPPENCIAELERCVEELGFVGCNINPDPSDGYWTDPPMTDRWWYPLYERMVELRVPAMVHVSMSCNPNFHGTGAHYLNGDTSAFMQFVLSDLFKDLPELQFVIPHGGGAVPFHWGRYRGIVQDLGKPPLDELVMNNLLFDTCVYHQAGIDFLLQVMGADNVIFASEMIGAVKGIDPETERYYDDTKPYVDLVPGITGADKTKIFQDNALRIYPRLAERLSPPTNPRLFT
jgi:4-oxalmesaconate hydratase